jgi:3D (Asp-Asp-Asp) domain-containing protein
MKLLGVWVLPLAVWVLPAIIGLGVLVYENVGAGSDGEFSSSSKPSAVLRLPAAGAGLSPQLRAISQSSQEKTPVGATSWTRITFYNCIPDGYCGLTFSGVQVVEGHAACDPSRLGWRFRIDGDPTGRTYVCTDTGSLVEGDHVDVWHYTEGEGWPWQAATGEYAWVEWGEPPASTASAASSS